MYIKTKCAYCRKNSFHDVEVQGFRRGNKYSLIRARVTDNVTEEELLEQILRMAGEYIYDGIKISELCQLLRNNFGISPDYFCDLIERIKLELDMYCPDHERLYYANPISA